MAGHTVTRYHDISCGHRVVGHEGKCRHLHGHNYRIHFTCAAVELDTVGRVIDFSLIKELLCGWLEEFWDHHFLVWDDDPVAAMLDQVDNTIIPVPFNPTAENMAEYLVKTMGPMMLAGTGVKLISVTVEETAKCSATFSI